MTQAESSAASALYLDANTLAGAANRHRLPIPKRGADLTCKPPLPPQPALKNLTAAAPATAPAPSEQQQQQQQCTQDDELARHGSSNDVIHSKAGAMAVAGTAVHAKAAIGSLTGTQQSAAVPTALTSPVVQMAQDYVNIDDGHHQHTQTDAGCRCSVS